MEGAEKWKVVQVWRKTEGLRLAIGRIIGQRFSAHQYRIESIVVSAIVPITICSSVFVFGAHPPAG